MKKYHYIIGFIVIISALVIFSYIFSTRKTNKDITSQDKNTISQNLALMTLPISSSTAEAITTPSAPPDGYIKYQNNKYSFYFYHSTEAKITEYDQGKGAMIITLENKQKVRGMQIFIVPYWEKTISEERFKADIPSGVRTNVEKTFVDGVEAVTFNSIDKDLGATREVWIIRGGYLYEITTFQGVGDWFIPKMQTWRFI